MRELARDVAARMPCERVLGQRRAGGGAPGDSAPGGGAPRLAFLTDAPPRLVLGGRLMADVAREIAAQMPACDASGLPAAR
jgi:hypothetical protein